ncbi:MAG: hypothetical protein RBU21_23830, partial [FCB group bacterium]|nr:hypothetical protein [FCB group bacterium]
GLLANGAVTDMADLARLGHVSRARITQIMNLRLLAPDIQEDLLFLPRIDAPRDPLKYADIGSLTLEPDWMVQRRRWLTMLPTDRRSSGSSQEGGSPQVSMDKR